MGIIKRLTTYIKNKRRLKGKCLFDITTKISLNAEFEGMNQIHRFAEYNGMMGLGTYIARHSSISADIGRFTSIGPNVKTISSIHPYTYPFVSTAPCFYALNPNNNQNGSTFASKQKLSESSAIDQQRNIDVKIGSDCWIGEGALLLGGVIVGDGAVVLARAVVNKNVPPYAIVGGIPAKIIKYRYSKDDIDFLLSIKWWNNPINWFQSNWELLCDLDKLKCHYK